MPVTQTQSGPYAPAPAVMGVVERYRDRGLPTPVTAEVLARAGVSESLVPRTLYSLQVLDLIDEAGKPTSVLEGIRLAPQGEYQARLGEWLNGAYAELLQFVDPATADEAAIRDAFRGYRPHGQLDRMVTLFMGLFRAAGIAPEKAMSGPPRKKPVGSGPLKPKLKPSFAAKAKQGTLADQHKPGGTVNFAGALPPAIAGLLASLPTQGQGWTKAQRDAFMATFEVVVDFCFPPGVVAKAKIEEGDDDAPDA